MTRKIRGRIIIDSKEHNNTIRDKDFEFIPDSKAIWPDMDEHLRMSNEELLMCIPSVWIHIDN